MKHFPRVLDIVLKLVCQGSVKSKEFFYPDECYI